MNKWVWEGALKVVSKGEECIIKLEDKNTGNDVGFISILKILLKLVTGICVFSSINFNLVI